MLLEQFLVSMLLCEAITCALASSVSFSELWVQIHLDCIGPCLHNFINIGYCAVQGCQFELQVE